MWELRREENYLSTHPKFSQNLFESKVFWSMGMAYYMRAKSMPSVEISLLPGA